MSSQHGRSERHTQNHKHNLPPKFTRVGHFGCVDCAYRWRSARAQAGVYQKCKHCLSPCYPSEFSYESANKHGNMNKETMIGHNMELCGKCEELGYSCQGEAEEGEDEVEAEEVELTKLMADTSIAIKSKQLSQKEKKKLLQKRNDKPEKANKVVSKDQSKNTGRS